jgi:4-alpha-glucanotransferase
MKVTVRSERVAGVLLHPTSLPGPHGIGDLGDGARRFVAWLAEAGMRRWQVLPLVPPGAGNSPYSTGSAFSGNPWLVDLVDLAGQGLLEMDALAPDGALRADRVDYEAVRAFKGPRLDRAAQRLLEKRDHPLQAHLERFRSEHAWVEDAALFSAVRQREGRPWWEWPADLRDREPDALRAARRALGDEIERWIVVQSFFDRQWRALRDVATAADVKLIGDVPIYVDADSADVWTHRRLFDLDPDGRRRAVAGVPPDAFSEVGQLWGNPLYRWDRLAAEGYGWWVERLSRALWQTDFVRIDHFRGFAAYWSVPADAPDARTGEWVEGPGLALFEALRAALGPLPVIAEDLGDIDAPVRHLLAQTGFPGMKVLQFAFGGEADNVYLPHHHLKRSVVYTGTHDNDTTRGWWNHAEERVRDHVRRYFGVDGHDVVWDFIRAAMASVADAAVVPAQDVLGLGREARMNTPAVAFGNWSWRMGEGALRPEMAARLRHLAVLYDRV